MGAALTRVRYFPERRTLGAIFSHPEFEGRLGRDALKHQTQNQKLQNCSQKGTMPLHFNKDLPQPQRSRIEAG
jgi:hypothetical protein